MKFNWFKKETIQKSPEKIWMTRQRKFQSIVEDALAGKQPDTFVVVVVFFQDTFLELQQCFKNQSASYTPCASGFTVSSLRSSPPPADAPIFLVMADALPVVGRPATKEEIYPNLRVVVIVAEHYPVRTKEEIVEQFVASLPYHASLCVQSSLDEELFLKFSGQRLLPILKSLGMDENQPLEHPLLAKSIANAQEKVKKVALSDLRCDSSRQWFELNCRKEL